MAGRIAYYGGIVTNGLVLNLDAAKRDSYPGSGTTWSDISGNRNNGTLTNGPTFNSDNGGSIVFDGVDDYVDTSATKNNIPTTSDVTFASWIYPTNNGAQDEWVIISNSTLYSPNYHNVAIGKFSDNKFYFNNYDGTEHRCYTDTSYNNIWVYVVGIRSNNNNFIYINAVRQTQSVASGTPNINTNIKLRIGSLFYKSRGNIAQTQIYNRALSAQEVLQNYNATKGRYGL